MTVNLFGGGLPLLRRRIMSPEQEGDSVKEFRLIDTISLTPDEQHKDIDMSVYGCTEFFICGNIPKTANSTYFRIGIGDLNLITPRNGTDVYAVELVAYVCIINGKALGFAGFDSGWSNGQTIGPMIPTPRSTPTTRIKIAFYPYVTGDEQAILEIYGR